ncbi:MAG: hypothetical protein GY851_35475 [bacterium]|nr:hypothetical protein [bacterium]
MMGKHFKDAPEASTISGMKEAMRQLHEAILDGTIPPFRTVECNGPADFNRISKAQASRDRTRAARSRHKRQAFWTALF